MEATLAVIVLMIVRLAIPAAIILSLGELVKKAGSRPHTR